MSRQRFHGRTEVLHVMRRGRLVKSNGFSLRLSGAGQRTAVVVSKKVDKKAVVRNRIRRRFMALIENMRKTVKFGDVIVIVHSNELESKNIQEISLQLSEALGD